MNSMSKSPGPTALVDRLQRDLGHDYFVEVPHWDSDRTAVGLGRPDDPRYLVYLAVQADNREVHVECEIPAPDDAAGIPYEVAASGDYADYEQLLRIVRSHLAR
jgi:hypothetical protein